MAGQTVCCQLCGLLGFAALEKLCHAPGELATLAERMQAPGTPR